MRATRLGMSVVVAPTFLPSPSPSAVLSFSARFGVVPAASVLRRLTASWPLEIRVAEGKGLGLFATRRFEAGEVVWEEAPIVAVQRRNAATTGSDDTSAASSSDTPLSPSKLFCDHCHAPIASPSILLTHPPDFSPDSASSHPESSSVWDHLCRQHTDDLQKIGLRAWRAPMAPTTPCRSTQPSHALFDAGHPPCEESFCSSACESAAWLAHHRREHMTPAEVERFIQADLSGVIAEPHLAEIVSLLLRVIAVMRCAPPAGTSDRPHSPTDPLTILDHLSHLSAPTSVEVLPPHDFLALFDAIGPLLTDVLARHPQMRLDSLPGSGTQEQRLLQAMIGALATNSFHLVHTRPSLVLEERARDEKTAELQLHYPEYVSEVDDVAHSLSHSHSHSHDSFGHFAAIFSLASFMNHACAPHHNIAIDSPSSTSFSPASVSLTGAASRRLIPFVARRPIAPNEELLWTYAHDADNLPKQYGFTCRCATCRSRATAGSGMAGST